MASGKAPWSGWSTGPAAACARPYCNHACHVRISIKHRDRIGIGAVGPRAGQDIVHVHRVTEASDDLALFGKG